MDNPTLEVSVEENPRSEAARIMGKVKSDKKTAAARENGKRGGRPKSTRPVEVKQPVSTKLGKDCPWCNGTGKEMGHECHRCHGRGTI